MKKHIASQTFAIWLIQVINVLLPIVDTYFLSRISIQDLSAYALASSFYVLWILGCKGVLQGITFATAPAVGSQDTMLVARLLINAFWLLIILTGVAWLALYLSGLGIANLPISETLKQLSRQYLQVVAFGVPAILAVRILVSWLESVNQSKTAVKWLWLGLFVKIIVTYLLLSGEFGERWQNTSGVALSTNLFYWLVAMGLSFSVYRQLKPKLTHKDHKATHHFLPNKKAIVHVLRYGLPIAVAYLLEYSLFPMITSLLAIIDERQLAVYEILVVVYDVAFSLPIAFIFATAIWTGQHYQTDLPMVVTYYRRFEKWLFVYVCLVIVTIWLLMPVWAVHYTTDKAMLALVATAMPAVLMRSGLDSLQTLTAFHLRAVDKGWTVVIINVLCLWGISFLGIKIAQHFTMLTVANVWWWLGIGYGVSWLILRKCWWRCLKNH